MPDNNTPRIAGAGIACIDYIVVAPQTAWGDTAFIKDFCVQGGGLVATALVACARLGAGCDLFSLLGKDQVGEQILSELVEEGINTQGVRIVEEGASPFSFIHVDDTSGERTIFHRSGINLRWTGNDEIFTSLQKSDCLIIDDIYPDLSLAAAIKAREYGVPVVADMIPNDNNTKILEHVDVLIAPRHFTRQIGCENDLDAALDAIHTLGPKTAVVTLGSDGWIYSDPGGRGRGEAFAVEVVDTTGAGDVFHGAFAYGLAQKWETARCAEFASAVAAIKCTRAGGRTGLPTLPQVMGFLKEKSRFNW